MMAHAHGMLAQAAWLGGCLATAPFASPGVVTVVGGAAAAVGAGVAPDLDVDGTAARSLGLGTRLVSWLIRRVTNHREETHWLSTGAVVSFAVAMTTAITFPVRLPVSTVTEFLGLWRGPDVTIRAPWLAWVVLVLLLAFAEAAMAADDPKHKRMWVITRWAFAVTGASVLLYLDPTLRWLPVAVLVGWWGHILGDCFTVSPFQALMPFSDRLVGGWGIIKPAQRDGRRVRRQVTRTERLIDLGLWVGCGAAYATLWGWWGPTITWVLANVRFGGAVGTL